MLRPWFEMRPLRCSALRLEGVCVKFIVLFLSSPFWGPQTPTLPLSQSEPDAIRSYESKGPERSWWQSFCLILWIWLLLTVPSYASVLLRVGISVNATKVTVGSSSQARILNSQGQPLADVPPMTPLSGGRSGQTVQLGSVTDSRLYLQPLSADGLVFIDKNWYRGLVELLPGDNGVIAVNQVGLDDYVSSVIGSEMGHRFPPEALKAQAVASRTYVLFHRNQRLQKPFDVGDDTTWQVYKGVSAESNLTQMAARDTSDQVLTYQNDIINAVFHSSSGGHTEDVANVWVEPLPYLKGVPDYDANAPVFNWTLRLNSTQVQQALGGVGTITSIDVIERTPYGRVKTVRISGTAGSKTLTSNEIRQRLQLKSTKFSITPTGVDTTTASLIPVAGSPSQFLITGQGFGHGLGMSQWGAAALAGEGWSYQQILSHYYQGTGLATLQ